MVCTSELLGNVRPFPLVIPHIIQLVKTDPPPIQHSRHNPQEGLLHIIQQHQKLVSKGVHESIVHGASWNMFFWDISSLSYRSLKKQSNVLCIVGSMEDSNNKLSLLWSGCSHCGDAPHRLGTPTRSPNRSGSKTKIDITLYKTTDRFVLRFILHREYRTISLSNVTYTINECP